MLPQFHRILFATDQSEVARHAMGYAFSLAAAYAAQLTILQVLPDLAVELSQRAGLDPASLLGSGGSLDWLEQAQRSTSEEIHRQLDALCLEIGQSCTGAVRPEILIRHGDPVEAILECAQDGGFDCIVVGSHGQGMVSRLLVGSVAEGVVRGSRIPVLVTPVHDEE